MSIIKDANYWKEYNAKRKVYLQQKYLQRKQVVNSTTNENNLVVKSEVVKSETVVENILQPKSEVVKSCKEIIQPELVVKKENLQLELIIQPSSPPCQNCLQLKAKNERLQWKVDNCQKRHTIPKEADFINLLWDRKHKKFVLYNCSDSCWVGKYCNNCGALEQQLKNRINQKPYERSL